MVIAEVSVVPIGTKTPSVSEYVAKAIKVLREEKGVKYQLTAMGTLVESELDEVLEAAKEMHECLFDEDVKRVRDWLVGLGVKTLFIDPGSPWENPNLKSGTITSVIDTSCP